MLFFFHPKSMAERTLLVKFHEILDLFRTIFANDNDILNGIDDTYEEVLTKELILIPEQYDDLILQYLTIVEVLAKNINFKNIANELETLKAENKLPSYELSSFDMISAGIKLINTAKGNRFRILNMLIKLKPLFKCVDKVMSMPIDILKRIGEMTENSNKYDDLI